MIAGLFASVDPGRHLNPGKVVPSLADTAGPTA
jgi:hypothetical protein